MRELRVHWRENRPEPEQPRDIFAELDELAQQRGPGDG